MSEQRIKNRRESDLRSCEVTAVTNKAQKKILRLTHDLMGHGSWSLVRIPLKPQNFSGLCL